MELKTVSGAILPPLLIGILILTFKIQPACLHAGGSIMGTSPSLETATLQTIQPLGATGSGWILDELVYDDPDYNEQHPSMATDSNGYLYVAHETSYEDAIAVSRSTDGGHTWSVFGWHNPEVVHPANPSIAIDPHDDRIYVAFEQKELVSQNHDIYCWVHDPLQGWLDPVRVDIRTWYDTRYPSVACQYQYGSQNYVFISYEYTRDYDDREMLVAKSTDHGATWNKTWHTRGHDDTDVHMQTSIAIAPNGYVYVAYASGADYGSQKDLVVEYGQDDSTGSTFENRVTVYNASTHGYMGASCPSISASHGNSDHIVIAWQLYNSSTNDDVMYAYTTSGGIDWGWGSIAASASNERYPEIAVDGQGSNSTDILGNFHVSYYYGVGRPYHLCYKRANYSSLHNWSDYYENPDSVVIDEPPEGGWRSISITTRSYDGVWYPCIAWADSRSITNAIYYSTYGLTYTITTDPSGLQTWVGASHTAPVSFNWAAGSEHTIYAPSPQSGDTGTQYVYVNWSDGGAQSHQITIVPPDKTITASYKTQYYLTVNSSYGTPAGAGWHDDGSTAYAALDTGNVTDGNGVRYLFTHWSGDASGTNYAQSDPITMDAPKTAIANWEISQYYLTMSTNFGTVVPGSGWHDVGESVQISATPPTAGSGGQYVWNGWTGSGPGSYTGMDNPANIIMNGPINETASWTYRDVIEVPYDYETIREAVSVAYPGDTILVHAGTYTERKLGIAKELTIIGDGSDSTFVYRSRDWAISLYDDVKITGLTIQGLYVYGSGNNITNCNFVNLGIYLREGSANNSISGNTLSNCYYGIYLISSTGNIVINNTMAYSSYGLFLSDSNGNIFYHNNLLNNTDNLDRSMSPTNYWDNGVEGNYWSDYEGDDLDGDGIGDTNLPHQNVDYHPLIEQWSSFRMFSANVAGETYYVNTHSNHVIASFGFSELLKEIGFNVTGPSGETGFCNITIPKNFLRANATHPWTVKLDGANIADQATINENATHTFIYLTFQFQSTCNIQTTGTWVVPEFPAWTSMLLMLIVITFAMVVYRRRPSKYPFNVNLLLCDHPCA